MKKPKAYRIRYSIEPGEWYPPISDVDKKPKPGLRVLQRKGTTKICNLGYTDEIALCSMVKGDQGKIESYLWAIPPTFRKKDLEDLLESFKHWIQAHAHYHD